MVCQSLVGGPGGHSARANTAHCRGTGGGDMRVKGYMVEMAHEDGVLTAHARKRWLAWL
jgi:hypothetical protein